MPQQFRAGTKMFNTASKYKGHKPVHTRRTTDGQIKKKKCSTSLVIKEIQTKIRINFGGVQQIGHIKKINK